MFIGEYLHTVDQKGRINVPAKFREVLGEAFILTKGLDNCIFVYHKDIWAEFEEKLKQIPITSKDGRKFVRFFASSAVEACPDNLGRIIIPLNLRKHANLTKEIVSIGANDRVEIWDKEKWECYNDNENYIEDELAEKMAEYGI